MKIAIVGAGAVGGFFGAYLKKAEHDVTFVARGQHLEAMKKSGLKVIANGDAFTVDGVFTNDLHSLSDAELILVCVKSTDTKEIAEQIANLGNEHAIIMTLQNGVDNEEILADVFGVERVLSAATYVSSQISEHGTIKQNGRVKLVIGALHESLVPYRDRIAELFNEAHIDTSTKDTIMEQKWKKFLWNATFNPLAALSTATVGEILDDEELRKTAEKVCREVILIANKSGIPLKKKMFEITFSNAEYARKHKPSMLQDRLRGKRMEIESLLGYLVKKSRRLQVEAPAIQAIYSNLLFIDSQK